MNDPQKFYKLKMDLYASIEQKLSEVIHTVRSIQVHEIDAPCSDVEELKELNRMCTQLGEVRTTACCMIDALHPLVDDVPRDREFFCDDDSCPGSEGFWVNRPGGDWSEPVECGRCDGPASLDEGPASPGSNC